MKNNSKQFKTIQKLLLAILLVSITGFYACKKNETEVKQVASFENLSKDKDFITLLKMNDEFLTKIPNLKIVAEIYKSKNEDRNSFLRLLKALGFETEAEYTKFFNTQNNYKKILNEKFDFGSLTTTEKSSLVSKLAVLLITDSKTSLSYSPYGKLSLVDPNGQSTCSERRSSCNRSASATYTMEGLACIGAATLVGSGTFGLGGAAIYGICVSAAAVHYSSVLDDCNYAYEDCMGFKPRTTD